MVGDVQKGVIDEPTLIDKVNEVYDTLKYSEVPGLPPQAEALQRAMVRGSGIESNVDALMDSCAIILDIDYR